MRYTDFRSDTVTEPTDEMRKAMAQAVVGHDVYGDDVTVNRLEELAAQYLGKEAAVFVPSGSMGNQLAIYTHTARADEVICAEGIHVVQHELGAAALIAGVTLRTSACENSMLTGAEVRRLWHDPQSTLDAETGLVCMENALSNAKVMPLDMMKEVYDTAKELNLSVHLDGARIFNAAAALRCEVKDIARYCDTVMFCLSKGLAAPIGSMLCGDAEFIRRARKNRKRIGGALRQVGVLAAPGIIALTEMSKRIAEDNENARYLAERIAELDGFSVIGKPEINMVFIGYPEHLDTQELAKFALENGIKISPARENKLRFVTHYQVTRQDIDRLVSIICEFIEKRQ